MGHKRFQRTWQETKAWCVDERNQEISFLHRKVGAWNDLEKEVVQAKMVSDFKAKLDKSRYRDWTV